MPHSSGGGSHGGGSHGGGSFGGGSHGGSSGSPSYTHSRRYFRGSRCFVRYVNHAPQYIYCNNSNPEQYLRSQISANKTAGVITAVLTAIALVALLFVAFVPKKISGTSKFDILIEDNANCLTGDIEELRDSLEKFKDKTGVVPAVITVKGGTWEQNYSYSLINYSYELYLSNFDDEKHWLIVYSSPNNPTGEFTDWHWEGMIGDDVGSVISSDAERAMTTNMQSQLYRYAESDLCKAIGGAFDRTLPECGKTSLDSLMPFILIVVALAFMTLISVVAVAIKKKQLKEIEGAISLPDNGGKEYETDVCEYCRGIYVHGAHTSCPHCGAPVARY